MVIEALQMIPTIKTLAFQNAFGNTNPDPDLKYQNATDKRAPVRTIKYLISHLYKHLTIFGTIEQ